MGIAGLKIEGRAPVSAGPRLGREGLRAAGGAEFVGRWRDRAGAPVNRLASLAEFDRPPPAEGGGRGAFASRERTIEELKTLVRAMQIGVTDPWQLTDLIFYARHPEMIGRSLSGERQELLDEWNAISARFVYPMLGEVSARLEEGTGTNFDTAAVTPAGDPGDRAASEIRLGGRAPDQFDEIIVRAAEWCPGLSPGLLKSLLVQESNCNPRVINRYGYAGIAQFGREAAREVGLRVGVAGSPTDERLNPWRAIPAAARLLNLKARRLEESAFSRYGRPAGTEYWKFVLAAYNGGEGTVSLAMGHAYRTGLAEAHTRGLAGRAAVADARAYASRWENLKKGGAKAPLALAAARYFPALAAAKFYEIGNYPTQILARAARG